MDAKELPARPSLEQYKKQAKDLVKACKSGDLETVQRIKKNHPRLGKLPGAEILNTKVALADAQLVIAREYAFESWPKFAKHIEELARANSSVSMVESAVGAIIAGDVAAPTRLLRETPHLIPHRPPRLHPTPPLHSLR